jgi:hypothetical protein
MRSIGSELEPGAPGSFVWGAGLAFWIMVSDERVTETAMVAQNWMIAWLGNDFWRVIVGRLII